MSIVDMDVHPSRYIYKQTAGNLPADCMEISAGGTLRGDREALITGIEAWGYGGYAEVGTPEIATEAGVTRGDVPPPPIKQHYSAMWWRSEQDVIPRWLPLVAA